MALWGLLGDERGVSHDRKEQGGLLLATGKGEVNTGDVSLRGQTGNGFLIALVDWML